MQSIKVKRKVTSSRLHIAELKKFMGKQVEITVTESNEAFSGQMAAGILSDFQSIDYTSKEKEAWGIVANEKHGNC
jgi:hypothetical protein